MVVSTPVLELEADVLERMQDYVAQLAAGFERITRHYWAGVYLNGLLLDGERKSIQPLAQRVTVPGWQATPCRRCSNSSLTVAGTNWPYCAPIGGGWRRRSPIRRA